MILNAKSLEAQTPSFPTRKTVSHPPHTFLSRQPTFLQNKSNSSASTVPHRKRTNTTLQAVTPRITTSKSAEHHQSRKNAESGHHRVKTMETVDPCRESGNEKNQSRSI